MALLSGRRDAFFQSLMWVLIAHVKWLLVHNTYAVIVAESTSLMYPGEQPLPCE